MAFRFRTYIKSHYIYLYERVGRACGGRMPFHWFTRPHSTAFPLCFILFCRFSHTNWIVLCRVMAVVKGVREGGSVYIARTVWAVEQTIVCRGGGVRVSGCVCGRGQKRGVWNCGELLVASQHRSVRNARRMPVPLIKKKQKTNERTKNGGDFEKNVWSRLSRWGT